MKRKFHLTNIEIILPRNKRIKISKLSVKLKNKMSESEFEEILNETRPKWSKYRQYNQEKTDDSEYLTSPTISRHESNNEQGTQEESILEKEEVISSPETDNTTEHSIVHTPPYSESEYDNIAKRLMNLDWRKKGEEMEIAIKDQLEKERFTVTKTQSSIGNRIIGDNGVDLFAQLKINDQIIRIAIQSKNWKTPITGNVVRDLQGTIAHQYPDRIGLIVINNGGIDSRARNLAENSTNTILIYNFSQLKNLRKNLRKLLEQNKINTFQQTIEEFDNVEIKEQQGKTKWTIKAKRYRRY